MDTNRHELVCGEEVYQIVGCAMEVLNTLGHGLFEKCYENALAVELKLEGISYLRQKTYRVDYKGEEVGTYVPDLIAFEQVVVEIKTVDRICDAQRGQLINYLRVTQLPVGVILNFKNPKLEWERLVL